MVNFIPLTFSVLKNNRNMGVDNYKITKYEGK